MLTAFQRSPLRVGMGDDLAQRLLRGGRRLDCSANLAETAQLTKQRYLSGRSFFLNFVHIYKEDADDF